MLENVIRFFIVRKDGLMPKKKETGKSVDDLNWEGLVRASILSATVQKLFNYINLADQKAMGLIILNSVIIPLAINGTENPLYKMPATLTILTGAFSVSLALFCIFPKRRMGRKPNGTMNLFHFGDISLFTEKDFLKEFNPIFNDRQRLSQEVIKDIHDTSKNILRPKFKWLKMAYVIFFIGNLLALSAFLFNIWI